MMKYSKKVMQEFLHPKNMGEIKSPDGVGKIGNPICGDIMWIYIKVKNDKITDIKFKTFGCVAAIAISSMITQLAKGRTTEEANKIKIKDVASSLKGLPPLKMHCSELATDALRLAIKDYEKRKKK